MSAFASASTAPVGSESVLDMLWHTEQTKMMILSGVTVLTYDHILTFNEELNLIWRSKIGLVSWIFLFNRYLVPALLAVDIYENFYLDMPYHQEIQFCKLWTMIQGYLTILSFMSIHVIVAFRVYALHGGRPWVGRVLWAAGIIYTVVCLGLSTLAQLPQTSPWPDSVRVVWHQCLGSIPSWSWAIWLPSVVFETLLFGLTMAAALCQTTDGVSFNSMYQILYRDGILYFLAVSLCSLFSLLVWVTAPPSLIGLGRYFALALVNVAGSRLVLNLKDYAARHREAMSESREPRRSQTDSETELCPIQHPIADNYPSPQMQQARDDEERQGYLTLAIPGNVYHGQTRSQAHGYGNDEIRGLTPSPAPSSVIYHPVDSAASEDWNQRRLSPARSREDFGHYPPTPSPRPSPQYGQFEPRPGRTSPTAAWRLERKQTRSRSRDYLRQPDPPSQIESTGTVSAIEVLYGYAV
ncbi:hypothetical protein PLICRDRAFT_46746 [Plicaturopsis crispa FD-325 SS-3]|uniref:DUF6533 domain-containing protein n=1 Tax=Plicaturopsis crispa FD-325 SS-3 TaxID=944288 RepID=A0A0C9T751_PLICR|nr:hypothetical protein PLICRDRAFT_46746 [Plicaturopsis crispa FD-325 SS-3]